MKEDIKKRARQEALRRFQNYISEREEKRKKAVGEYEELLIEYYRTEYFLDFLVKMEKHSQDYKGHNEMEHLKKNQIVILKKINDIENSGVLDEYEAMTIAIQEMDSEKASM